MDKTRHGTEAPAYKHGETGSRLHYVWEQMRYRCHNPTHRAYKWYGKRGIVVCDDWHEYVPFRDWALANGYHEGLTIDRIDNDGNYEPDNCQWIPLAINAGKRSSPRLPVDN